ncbi:MAG: preprotein translocase subunit YajC [Planctomycetota bacterium]
MNDRSDRWTAAHTWLFVGAATGAPSLALAQEGGPQIPGTPGATPGSAPADPAGGTTPGGTGAPPAGGLGGMLIWLLPLMLIFIIFTSSMSQRKERKKTEEMLSTLRRGDRVQTVGGIIGRIAELKTDEVTLRVDEESGTRIRFKRTAIQKVVSQGPEPKTAPDESEAETVA